jgi:hypothetical protein
MKKSSKTNKNKDLSIKKIAFKLSIGEIDC